MKSKMLAVLCGLAIVATITSVSVAGFARQYYSSWSYYPSNGYYYSTYYYQPYSSYQGYQYHYSIYYPSQPRYVYYYNPYSRAYWGRLDLEAKDGAQYSMLAEKDRKEKLTDIPEAAFPKPATMPAIPESSDGVAMEPIKFSPEKDLPKP